MTEFLKKPETRTFFIRFLVHFISILVIGVFLSVGWFIFKVWSSSPRDASALMADWLWYLGVGFIMVMVNYFGAAIPQLKDLISTLVGFRTASPSPTPTNPEIK